MNNVKIQAKELTVFLLGCSILTLGMSLIIKSRVGAGPWDSLNVGLSQKVGLTPGFWMFLVSTILIFINSGISKKKPELASFVTNGIMAIFVDAWLKMYEIPATGLYSNLFINILGFIVASLGAAIYIVSRKSITSLDRLMINICSITGLNITKSKLIVEIIGLTLSCIIGGPLGIGTVVAMTLPPIILKFMIPIFSKVTNLPNPN